jgi:citrate synthase
MTEETIPLASEHGLPVPETAIASIDGGLRFRGYAIDDLVDQSNFPEVAFLVIRGELPSHEQLADLQAILTEASVLEPDLLAWIERIPLNASAIDVLRTAVSLIALSECHDDDSSPGGAWDAVQRLLAQLPVLVAARYRLARGQTVLETRDDLSYAGNLLWLFTGREPTSTAERAFDALLILTAEHEFAPSTCAARVVASTRADFYSAVIGGMCAIKGAWHGGPGRQIIDILEAVARPEAAGTIVRAVLEQYERIPGFWHRVYRTSDPRAELLAPFCQKVADESGRQQTEQVAMAIEAAVWEEQQILPSLDWSAARVLHYMNLDADLFVPIFTISRMVSWAAHYIEQQQSPQPIRPRGTYVGPPDRQFLPLGERG